MLLRRRRCGDRGGRGSRSHGAKIRKQDRERLGREGWERRPLLLVVVVVTIILFRRLLGVHKTFILSFTYISP